jgi:hypothetical protein
MLLRDERLKEALEAGNIPVTEKALAILREWVVEEASATLFLAERIRTGKPRADLKKELSKLCAALQIVVDILNRDGGWLTDFDINFVPAGTIVLKTWNRGMEDGKPTGLLISAQAALKRLEALKKRSHSGAPIHPNTPFLRAVRILYGMLTGEDDPAIAGPLHRFARAYAELIGADGMVPESENGFRARYRAVRRT